MVMVDRSVLSAVEENDQEYLDTLPDWQTAEVEIAQAIRADTSGRFIKPPDKFDSHEYHHMERFIGSLADGQVADQLWRAIKGRGAFRCFSYRLGIQDEWFHYRDEAMRDFARA